MTAATGIQYGSGFRYGLVYALNANGRLAGNSPTTPYRGVSFAGNKAWNLTIPKQRRLNHLNADRVGAADFLPPTEAASGTITVSADNQVLDALLTGSKQRTDMGEMSEIADLTSNQGYEPIIALMLWQQGLDSVSRLRSWRSFLIPRAKAIPLLSGFADREVDGTYDVLMTPSSTNIFGAALTSVLDGVTDAQLFRAMTAGRPALMAWQGDGATVAFTYPADTSPALSVAKVAVWVNGVLTSAGITVTTTSVTFAVAPANGVDIDIFWEY